MPRAKKVTKKIEETNVVTSGINIGSIIATIILLVLVGAGGVYLSKFNANRTPSKQVAAVQTIAYDCAEGQDALSALKEKADVTTQDSDYGVFVDSINGSTNSDSNFWIYYVNGQMGQVGADKYDCKTGDKVEWRYESLTL